MFQVSDFIHPASREEISWYAGRVYVGFKKTIPNRPPTSPRCAQNLGLSVLEVIRCVPAGVLCFLWLGFPAGA